jgi:hypothetical protein
MRALVTTLTTLLLATATSGPALARPQAADPCANAGGPDRPDGTASRQRATRSGALVSWRSSGSAPGSSWRVAQPPRHWLNLQGRAMSPGQRAAARTEAAISGFERALTRADRLGLASRRSLAALRRDVLFLRGLLTGLRRDGRLDPQEIATLDATVADLGLRIDAALAPRGVSFPRATR